MKQALTHRLLKATMISLSLLLMLMGQASSDENSAGFEIVDPALDWPLLYGVQQTGEIATTFDCYGKFGLSFTPHPNYSNYWPVSSFESPQGSNLEYLAGGSIWIGGNINDTLLVATGYQGNFGYPSDFTPTGLASEFHLETVERISSVADFSMRAAFADTLYPLTNGFRHYELNIMVSLRSHIWRSPGQNETVIYDMVVTNIGRSEITGGFVGLYVDNDICTDCFFTQGHNDDFVGSLRQQGIIYAMDNDGNPIGQTGYSPGWSQTSIVGTKYINPSFESSDSSFNWWGPLSYYFLEDGPRQVDSLDSLISCSQYNSEYSTPFDDARYCFMSGPEWDYDQFRAGIDNPGWSSREDSIGVAKGMDSRYLFSIGKFNLLPDSSIRVQFAMFMGKYGHTKPTNIANLPSRPDLYLNNIDFTDLLNNARITDSLAGSLLDPLQPPPAVDLVFHSNDSAVVEWDRYVYPEVTGYNIYIGEIPDTLFKYPYYPTPGYTPDSMQLVASLGNARRIILSELDTRKTYVVRIAHQTFSGEGAMSYPLLIPSRTRIAAPQLPLEHIFMSPGQPARLEWESPDVDDLAFINIYKFPTTQDAANRYYPFYDDGYWKSELPVADSVFIDNKMLYFYRMIPYDSVDAEVTSYNDFYASDGNVYVMTSVDKFGRESFFSIEINISLIGEQTKDILVLTQSSLNVDNFVISDSIKSFYQNLLQGYDYDIYMTHDSSLNFNHDQFDWHLMPEYRLVIIDDDLQATIINREYEDSTTGFSRYLLSGGRIAYFGSLGGFFGSDFHRQPTTFKANHPFLNDLLGIDSLTITGLAYFFDSTTFPFTDTIFGFNKAEAIISPIPSLDFIENYPGFTDLYKTFWPTNTAPIVTTFVPGDSAATTHIYQSLAESSSLFQGDPVGITNSFHGVKTYAFGFHLWYMDPISARQLIDYIILLPTDVNDNETNLLPNSVKLFQNHPNPFNPITTISFSLPARNKISLEIYNLLGQKVRSLITETELSAGFHTVSWDGTNESGSVSASGIYFYRLKYGELIQNRKMILLK